MVFWGNDLQMSTLAYGLLLGAVGAFLSSLGLCIWASIAFTRRNALRLLGPEGHDADARVLAKEVVRHDTINGVPNPRGAGCARPYYLCSYVFDAARTDGVTCRVEVRRRKVPSFVYKTLTPGDTAKVRFLAAEPRRCRLAAAAEHERLGPQSMRLRTGLGALLFVTGAVAMALSIIDHHVAGAIIYGVIELFTVGWLMVGEMLLRKLFPCFACWHLREAWSPLFAHPGIVFMSEQGPGVEPSCKPDAVIPEHVHISSGNFMA